MMHELTGTILNGSLLNFDAYGHPIVLIKLNETQSALKMVDELKGCDKVAIKIGKVKKKRSLDANAYCWTLIGKIAEKTGLGTSEIYRNAIKEIGGNSDTVCIQDHAVESLCSGWSRNGLGWQTDTVKSKLEGCTNVILYYGSSTYDTEQMSRLINILIQECEQLDIETRSPQEIESLLNSWR